MTLTSKPDPIPIIFDSDPDQHHDYHRNVADSGPGRSAGERLRCRALLPLGSGGAAVRQGACGGFAKQDSSGGNPRGFAPAREGEAAGTGDRAAVRKRKQ